nr:immunoglobulin light chain junction region [Macaca mulatta]MOW12127.1 immunoglobulin light chain junction region [Macaca mulatta]MOW13788.1 immunoglobulin light chain junction region [Macaca mulatta]MOX07052.1 immunoglobulin light chain junction region [Macaca mulatta]MOX07109.1 immunoglobulin light chain junction region [Macaca mulatta]
CQQHNSYPTF